MKRILIITLLLATHICHAEEIRTIDSKVISATVFRDRAMITREASITLSKGIHTIIFSKLTSDLQDASVRVAANGISDLKILDVNVERKFTTEIQGDKIRALQAKIDSLNVQLSIITDRMAALQSQKEFVESLKAESVKDINQKMVTNPASPKSWTEMVQFIGTTLNDVYNGLRKQRRLKYKIELEIQAIQRTMEELRGNQGRDYKDISVKIETGTQGNIKLYPSYLVRNVTWYPMYDARVSSVDKALELAYYGMIQQSTGEDWNDIQLTFSTAEPMTVKSLPELDRWFVDVRPLPVKTERRLSQPGRSNFKIDYEQNWGLPRGTGVISGFIIDGRTGEALPGANVSLGGTAYGAATDMSGKFYISNIPVGRYNLEVMYIGYQNMTINVEVVEKQIASVTIPLEFSKISGKEVVVVAERDEIKMDMNSALTIQSGERGKSIPKPTYSDVHAKELSTTFALKTKNSIPSDNSMHKVTITIDDLPIEFEYTAIPKAIPKVYLKGKVVNNNSYPLLEGEINVFMDNDFVNKTFFNTIVANDTLELPLGVDENIQVEKVLINKYNESKGILKGNTKLTYEYEIQVMNNRKTAERVWIYDQLPIPMNERIKIDLLTSDLDDKELDNDKKLEWHPELKAGEKLVIPLKYTVEYPKNQRVYGLE
ncbi:mucoidy inhibitor MuiA family protein [candidate division KSB1 bacterium]|nr:mucoidy inhibitor MuiA family protein [candidate division KSB1 bacterium]